MLQNVRLQFQIYTNSKWFLLILKRPIPSSGLVAFKIHRVSQSPIPTNRWDIFTRYPTIKTYGISSLLIFSMRTWMNFLSRYKYVRTSNVYFSGLRTYLCLELYWVWQLLEKTVAPMVSLMAFYGHFSAQLPRHVSFLPHCDFTRKWQKKDRLLPGANYPVSVVYFFHSFYK